MQSMVFLSWSARNCSVSVRHQIVPTICSQAYMHEDIVHSVLYTCLIYVLHAQRLYVLLVGILIFVVRRRLGPQSCHQH